MEWLITCAYIHIVQNDNLVTDISSQSQYVILFRNHTWFVFVPSPLISVLQDPLICRFDPVIESCITGESQEIMLPFCHWKLHTTYILLYNKCLSLKYILSRAHPLINYNFLRDASACNTLYQPFLYSSLHLNCLLCLGCSCFGE